MKLIVLLAGLVGPLWVSAQQLASATSTVCLSVAPYAEVAMSAPLDLQPVNQAIKNPSHYRAETELWLEANSDVELNIMATAISHGQESVVPKVKLNNRSGIVDVPYEEGGSSHIIRMDVNWSEGHVQKAGLYEGEISVLVMTNFEDSGC